MSASPEKLVGIGHPDFRLEIGQTYAESILKRDKLNQANENMQDVIKEKVKTYANELIRYIEEFAIPLALIAYKKGTKSNEIGRVTWIVDSTTSKITIKIYMNSQNYVFMTEFTTRSLSWDIGNKIKEMYAAIPGVGVEISTPQSNHQSFLSIAITLPIDSVL